jgi:hypothetical protein
MIHGGNRKRGTTSCRKPLARRWWVEEAPYEVQQVFGVFGRVATTQLVDQRHEITCKACRQKLKLGKAERVALLGKALDASARRHVDCDCMSCRPP